jgi:hypothetical protein
VTVEIKNMNEEVYRSMRAEIDSEHQRKMDALHVLFPQFAPAYRNFVQEIPRVILPQPNGDKRTKRAWSWDPKVVAEVKRMSAEMMAPKEIASKLGLKVKMVSNIRQKYGLNSKPAPDPAPESIEPKAVPYRVKAAKKSRPMNGVEPNKRKSCESCRLYDAMGKCPGCSKAICGNCIKNFMNNCSECVSVPE